jgi:hypothetical protein
VNREPALGITRLAINAARLFGLDPKPAKKPV